MVLCIPNISSNKYKTSNEKGLRQHSNTDQAIEPHDNLVEVILYGLNADTSKRKQTWPQRGGENKENS